MICLVWEWGIFGTLSLDFPVLAEEERLFGGPGPGRGSKVCLGSGQALATEAGHHILAIPYSYSRGSTTWPAQGAVP